MSVQALPGLEVAVALIILLFQTYFFSQTHSKIRSL